MTPLSVNHHGQLPAITISFNLAPGVAPGQAVTAIEHSGLAMRLLAGVLADFQGTLLGAPSIARGVSPTDKTVHD